MTDRARRRLALTTIVLLVATVTGCTASGPPPARADPVSALVEYSEILADVLVSSTDLSSVDSDVRADMTSALSELGGVADVERVHLYRPGLESGSGMSRSADRAQFGYMGAQLGTMVLPGLIRDSFAAIAEGRSVDIDEIAEGPDGLPLQNADGTPQMRLTSSYQDGVLIIDGALRQRDGAPGSEVTINIATSAEVTGCPDALGQYSGTLTLETSVEYASPAGPVSGEFSQVVDLSGAVDDDARITSLEFDYHSTMRDGEASQSNSYLEASGSLATDTRLDEPAVWQGDSAIDRRSQAVSDDDADTFLESSVAAAGATASVIAVEVEKFFRSGACVTVQTSPGPEALSAAGQQIDIAISAKSTTDGETIETGTAKATLTSGAESVAPDGTPQLLPASILYTAANADDEGTVAYEVTSRRGIGHSEVTYRIGSAWLLDYDWEGVRYHAVKCGALDGDWTITRKGVPAGNGGSMDGVIEFTLDPVALFGYFDESVTLSVASGTIQGTFAGEVVIDRLDDGSAMLMLSTKSGTATFQGITTSAEVTKQEPPMPLARVGTAECVG